MRKACITLTALVVVIALACSMCACGSTTQNHYTVTFHRKSINAYGSEADIAKKADELVASAKKTVTSPGDGSTISSADPIEGTSSSGIDSGHGNIQLTFIWGAQQEGTTDAKPTTTVDVPVNVYPPSPIPK